MSKVLTALIAGVFALSAGIASAQDNAKKAEPAKATPATPAAPATPAKGDAAKATPAAV